MTPLQSNRYPFYDKNGNLLQSGRIYIGQPSTDPRVSSKTVTFQDSSGYQFTAAQPLTTTNGIIVYNGKPITTLVDGEYSLLVLDSSGNQVNYEASVNGSTSSATSNYSDLIRVGLVLDDVKAFDVAVGEVCRSVGRVTATDNLGADWLVISATGSAGDDVDLIDFANGLQGQRDKSKIYPIDVFAYITDKTFNPDSPTTVWTGSSTAINPSDFSDHGPGFYIVELSSGPQYNFYTNKDLTAITGSVIGSCYSSVVGPSAPFTLVFESCLLNYSYGGSAGTIRLTVETRQIDINNSGTVATGYSATYGTIAKVYKV